MGLKPIFSIISLVACVALFGVPFLRPPLRSPGLAPRPLLFTTLVMNYPYSLFWRWHRIKNLESVSLTPGLLPLYLRDYLYIRCL